MQRLLNGESALDLLPVFASYVVGPQPMDLLFSTFEIVAVAISAGVVALIAQVRAPAPAVRCDAGALLPRGPLLI